MIDEYFRLLEDWKRLPSYKLEVRIDSLVGFALPRVFLDIFGQETKMLIPELPIRRATVDPKHKGTKLANLSYKVDFYIRTQSGENLFIEFKTDSGSLRDSQNEYLRQSMTIGMKSIVEGILKIYKVTSYKKKYEHLLEKLQQAGLVDQQLAWQVGDEEIKVMFIQPKVLDENSDLQILDFNQLAGSIHKCFPSDELMNRLAISLETWQVD